MRNTLAIELSQRKGSVAVCTHSGQVVEKEVQMLQPKKNEDVVMPSIDRLCQEANLQPHEIELVGVSIGPGGFTGLRTAISIAKLIALSNGAATVGVESAIVAAATLQLGDGPLLIITSSKQDSFWQSTVEKVDSLWISESGLSEISSLQQLSSKVSHVVIDANISQELHDALESLNISTTRMQLQAASLLRVANKLYEVGQTISPHELVPLYPREPEAVRTWKTRHKGKH